MIHLLQSEAIRLSIGKLMQAKSQCVCNSTYMSSKSSFRGNKSQLPSKPCVTCGRDMTWRKSWAKNWEQVKYCCEQCRKNAPKGEDA
jgi:hypothetical protein